MHRNTALIIVFLAIFAAMVIGVNLGRTSSSFERTTLSPEPTLAPELSPTSSPSLLFYTDPTCGISFSYPNTFTKVNIGTGGVTLANPKNADETVVAICQKDIPKPALAANSIESVSIGSVSGKLYHDASQKDGNPLDILIFTHPKTKKDIYVAGQGQTYQQIIQTLQVNF